MTGGATAARAPGQGYWRASRAPRYSLTFALPLLIGYEALAFLLPARETHGVRNGAEVLLRGAFAFVAGPWGDILFGAIAISVAGWLVVRDVRASGAPSARIFGVMLLESALLAVVFGLVSAVLTTRILGALPALLLGPPPGIDARTELMVSLGAGVFEELLFRVVLVSALISLVRVVFGAGARTSAAVAVVLSALLFSAFHYLGPYGDVLKLPSFLFRAIGGLLFSVIYVLRGFGIVAWTHALYDVGLLTLIGT